MWTHPRFSKLHCAFFSAFLVNFGFPYTVAHNHNSNKADLTTLKLVQAVFRHGDRSPIHEYPNDPYGNVAQYWPDGLGQLTKIGMMQHFLLGEYLRWRYDDFIDQVYNKDEIFVQSSNLDRTIMSAQANLAGMFPPKAKDQWNPKLNWQPIPVHSIPGKYDKILDFSISCPRYQEEFQNIIHSDSVLNVISDYKWLFDELSENTGKQIETLEQVADLYDTFFVQSQHGLVLPKFAEKLFPDKMKPLFELHFKLLEYNDKMMQLRGGPLLKKIVWYMDLIRKRTNDAAAEKYSKPLNGQLNDHIPPEHRRAKMYVYSGHDSSLSALLNTLGVYNDIVPPYASCILIELHGTEAEPDLDFVKIYYRNNTKEFPYELHIPDCGDPCRLPRLKELKKNLMIKDWEGECQKTSLEDNLIMEQVTSVLFFMGLAALLIIIFMKICGIRRKRIFTVDVANSKLV